MTRPTSTGFIAGSIPRCWSRTCSLKSRLLKSLGLWIDGLIEINPKDTREKCQHRGKGQEKQGCPDGDLVQTPSGQNPKDCPKSEDEGQGQTVTDVHGAEEVSWLAVEEKTAGGTAIIHLWEAPVDGGAEDSAGPASRTKLAEDAA